VRNPSEPIEDGKATSNPARGLPRATRRLVKPTHDSRTTPFIEKLEDVRRIYLDLPESLNVAYAIGAFAGLRTGEVLGLDTSFSGAGARPWSRWAATTQSKPNANSNADRTSLHRAAERVVMRAPSLPLATVWR
jgi:hypothetical protein